MRFSLLLENEHGERLDFSRTANQYMVTKIEGLSPPAGTISTSGYAGMSGSYLNNAFIEKRNIVINFKMQGINIERRRHALYRVVQPSRYIRVYYRTAGIDVYTEGIVESCPVNNFELLTSGQISILCPDIYWYSRSPVYARFGKIIKSFIFPFPKSDEKFPLGVYDVTNMISLYNSGDEVGFTIIIETDTSENAPDISAKSVTVYNARTDEYLQIKGEIMKGDKIVITTKTGNKTVTMTRNGITQNIINRLASGSTWLSVSPGENHFRIDGGQHLNITFMHTDAFLGV